jgi:hypothetical protein
MSEIDMPGIDTYESAVRPVVVGTDPVGMSNR